MSFPSVERGGSLLLAWQIKDRRVLVVGGGEVAAGRILNLLNADALVTVVSPASGLNAEVAFRVATEEAVTHVDRVFEPQDLDDASISMVLTAIDDPQASSEVWKLCKARRIPVNVADVPPECDFYFGSTHRDGPLQIMVSTNGNGPRLARIVRQQISRTLPKNVGNAIQKVGALRRQLRRVAPAIEQGPKRMAWMSRICEAWSLEDLCDMSESDMTQLLGFYEPDQVPTLGQLRAGDSEVLFEEDIMGSFGWSCVI